MDETQRARVAVVGSGIAGLTAAYLLQRRYDVLLFEAGDRLGGHAHTHEVPADAVAVDSGFIVHNERTYPNLVRLFRELDVATQDSDMSMSVRCLGCGLEYAGAKGPRGLFARKSSLARPEFLRMLGEVKRFHRDARALLNGQEFGARAGASRRAGRTAATTGEGRRAQETDADGAGGSVGAAAAEPTLGQFVERGGYSRYFTEHFLVPLVSAVWSTGPTLALSYPARYLFRFLEHHGMLAVTGSPRWRTVCGGSARYVEKTVKALTAVHLSTPVRAVVRHADGVEVFGAEGLGHEVAGVVLATHPDQALRMLADPSTAEREVLGAISYSRNETVLHTDASLLPRAKAARSSWNYLVAGCAAGGASERGCAVVSYHMNRLHRFDASRDYVVTLNGGSLIDPGSVIARMVYEHPVYTRASVAAQARLPELTGPRTAYAGAYHGWGFHEDGCASGVAAAAALGVAW